MLDLSKLYVVVIKEQNLPLSHVSLNVIGPFSSRKEGEGWLKKKGWVEKVSGTWFLPRKRSRYENRAENDNERAVVEEIVSTKHPSFDWPIRSDRA